MIHYQCPSCQAVHTSVDLMVGLTVFCKQCRHPILVPKASTVAAPIMEGTRELPPLIAAAKAKATTPEAARAVPSAAAPKRKPMIPWLILLLVIALTPLAYLAWRFFIS
jgi:hypothetical protein